MPMISIIMPVYNKEKYIRKSVTSILNQNYEDFELIIIDDGSTDNSLSIIEEYQKQDKRIKVISTENGGVSKARNIGLDNAKGKYVAFVDADDYVGNSFLESFVENEDEFVIGGLTKVNKEDKELGVVTSRLKGTFDMNQIVHSFYDEQLDTGIYGFVASKFISLELINKYHLRFDESIKLAEDYNFFLEIYSKIDEITFIDEKVYYYIQETENSAIIMDDSKIDFFQQIEIQKKAKQFLLSKNAFSQDNEIRFNRLMTGYVYTILFMNSQLTKKEFIELFSKLKDVVSLVDGNCSGLMKMVIHLYQKNQVKLIYYLLKIKKVMVR